MIDSDQTSLMPRQEASCRPAAEGLGARRGRRGSPDYAPGSARQTGHGLLRHPDISRHVAELRNEIRRGARLAVVRIDRRNRASPRAAGRAA